MLLWVTAASPAVVPAAPLLLVSWAVSLLRPTKKRTVMAYLMTAAALGTAAILIVLTWTPYHRRH